MQFTTGGAPPPSKGKMEETREPSEQDRRELRSRMKRVLTDFATIEAVDSVEELARKNLEREMRSLIHSWEFLCGMAEGVNVITRMYPFATQDSTFRVVARLVMVVVAKIGLEAIQEAEDLESFPEDLPI